MTHSSAPPSSAAQAAAQIAAAARRRGAFVATAESCTGGMVAAALTDAAGASAWFAGGVVAYSNAMKERLLGVPAALLAAEGAVSEAAARAMCDGAMRPPVTAAVAVTGVAGPGGGAADKPVGGVYFCCRVGARARAMYRRFDGGRDEVRRQASDAALMLLAEMLAQAD